jgi:hypothetical protein
VGRLEDGHVELSILGSGASTWSARAALEDLDLAGLGAQLGAAAELGGHGRLALSAEGRGTAVTGGELTLAVPDAAIRGPGFALLGGIDLEARQGGPWRLDLGRAELRVGELLVKPVGAELVVSAEPDPELPPRAIRSIRLRSEPVVLDAEARLAGAGAGVDVSGGRIDLARLAAWWQGAWRPLGGSVAIETAHFGARGGAFELEGAFEGARVSLPEAAGAAPAGAESAALSGPFALRGTSLESSGLELALADQRAVLQGRFDLATHAFDADFEADSLDVGRILAAFSGSPALEGRLSARASLSGAGNLDSIQGNGSFSIEKGRIPGADFPWPVEVQDPRLVTGDENRSFDSLGGRFFVVHGVAQFDQLFFHHPYLSAYLGGNVRLSDGSLDLRGELELSEELDAGLGGEGRRRVLPVKHVGGRLSDPQFEMDREAMAATFGGYAAAMRGSAGTP